jgi:hypothetical protein
MMMFGGVVSDAEHQLENAVMMLMKNAMNRKLSCITGPFVWDTQQVSVARSSV